jgi:limonene-1,2-epoxide hydrolase
MKRQNIELLLAWLDALRRDDRSAMNELVAGDVVWQGIGNAVCHGREEVISVFACQRDLDYEVDALELIGATRHAILHARPTRAPEGDVYNVFRIEDGRIARIDDHATRADALLAAGLPPP